MLNKLLLSFLVLISLSSFGQLEHSGLPFKGLQAARDADGKFWLLNKYDVKVIQIDSVSFNVTEVMGTIEASSIPDMDKKFIRQIVNVIDDDQKRMERLWGISRNFRSVDPIVMEAIYDSLLVKYGKRKLKKMLRKKKE